MADLYLEKHSDLPPEIPKKKRSRVHLAVYMTKLMNLMYLVLKYRREEATKFESFEALIHDRRFVESVLRTASDDPELSLEKHVSYYLDKFLSIKERQYEKILLWLENVWELTLSKFGSVYPLFNLDESFSGITILRQAGITGTGHPLRIRLPDFRAVFLEALPTSPGTLTKSTLYIGNSVKNPAINLDLAVRLPLRSEDLESAFRYQISFKTYYLLNGNFEVYPFLLRARRVSYGRMVKGKTLNEIIQIILNSRFLSHQHLERVVHGEYPLDVLIMMPIIYLNGALSFLIAFKGENNEPLTLGKTVRINISSEFFINAFRAGTSTLPVSIRPGRYIYLVAVPVTYPKIAAVLATFNEEDYKIPRVGSAFADSKRRHRKKFMTLEELLNR